PARRRPSASLPLRSRTSSYEPATARARLVPGTRFSPDEARRRHGHAGPSVLGRPLSQGPAGRCLKVDSRRGGSMTKTIQVTVAGGGYAGVMAANRLTQRDDVRVTLINPRPVFVERIRLHQLVCGIDDAVTDYREVLSERVDLVVDTVTRIDAAGREVTLGSGGTLGHDHLVYAVGSGSARPGVPGAEFAHPVAGLEEAQRLRPILAATPATAPVIVVGAGPTGIEVAAELADTGRSVTLVCGGVLGPYLHPRGRRAV